MGKQYVRKLQDIWKNRNIIILNLMITLLEQPGGSLHPFDPVQLELHQYMALAIELAPPDSASIQKC